MHRPASIGFGDAKAWGGRQFAGIGAAQKDQPTGEWIELIEINRREKSSDRAISERSVSVVAGGEKPEKLYRTNETDFVRSQLEGKADPEPVAEAGLDDGWVELEDTDPLPGHVDRFLSDFALGPEPTHWLIASVQRGQKEKQWLERVNQHYQDMESADLSEFKKLATARIAQGSDRDWLRVRDGLNLFLDKQNEAKQSPLIKALRQVLVEHFDRSAEAETRPSARLNRLKELLQMAKDSRYLDAEINTHAARFAKKVLLSIRTETQLENYLSLLKSYRSKGADQFLTLGKEFDAPIAKQRAKFCWYRQIESIDTAILRNPLSLFVPSLYVERGEANVELGFLNKAIADFTQAIELKPKYAFAYCRRGNVKDELGLYEDAKADYDQGIRLGEYTATTYNNRGVVKKHLGLWEEAKSDYTESIRLEPEYITAYINRGWVEHQLGHYPEAIADYNKAIELNPDSARAHHHRALANEQLGRHGEAAADRAKAHQLNPSTY